MNDGGLPAARPSFKESVMDVEQLVREAVNGNKTALEGVAAAIQDRVYNLALRMLVNPEDARDATQDILIKVITNLGSFRFESRFNTWVYRLAANYLITEKKIRDRDPQLNFEMYREDLESDLQAPGELSERPDYRILLNELRISCTMAMLLCLKPTHRMAYILGDIMELDHVDASEILDISKANFRQRLSRARVEVHAFTAQSCGVVNTHAACRCDRKLQGAMRRHRVDPEHIIFAERQIPLDELKASLRSTQESLRTLKLQSAIKPYKSPVDLANTIETIVAEGIHAAQKTTAKLQQH